MRGAAAHRGQSAAHKEVAYLARRLTGIVCDVPLSATLEDLRPRAPDSAALDRFFDAQGFGSILRQQVRRIAGNGGKAEKFT